MSRQRRSCTCNKYDGEQFEVFSNHKSLKYIFTQRDFTLHYHLSKANVVADALSRKSWGVLASIASREWQMLEIVGHFRPSLVTTLKVLWGVY